MKRKPVFISIDDIVRLFVDYLGDGADFPKDAQAHKIFLNPTDRRIMLEITSESLEGPQTTEQIKFKLKRTYVV